LTPSSRKICSPSLPIESLWLSTCCHDKRWSPT
jgi:hypothetical protein